MRSAVFTEGTVASTKTEVADADLRYANPAASAAHVVEAFGNECGLENPFIHALDVARSIELIGYDAPGP